MKTPCLISACLLGVRCRYDATHSALNGDLLKMLMESHVLVPVCPEQMGGLSTPRVPVQFEGGDGIALLEGRARMLSLKGEDLTLQFMEGAQEVLKLARILGIKKAVLKDKSPSCGVKMVYIADELKEGVGVTTALLIREGLKISAEGEL